MKWKTISCFSNDNYEVSDSGIVRRRMDRKGKKGPFAKAGNVLKTSKSHNGYDRVYLFDGKKLRNKSVHRLVAAAFIGPLPDGMQVNHKNGVKGDNRPSNLEYVTPKENMKHALEIGLKKTGQDHWAAVLRDENAEEIAKLSSSLTRRQLREKFGVSKSTIQRILSRSGRFAKDKAGVS